MKIKFFALIIILASYLSCSETSPKQDDGNIPEGNHKVLIQEVLQAKEYSYLRVKEADKSSWIAVVKSDFEEGETYYYVEGLPMQNFKSKDLDRTFEQVLFVNIISKKPILRKKQDETAMHGHSSTQKSVANETIKITPAKNGITIAQLFSEKEKYADKTVSVKGIVVKYNQQIMGRNWVHIQDGTKHDSEHELTITTYDEAAVGDTLIFEGKITLNKDFGSGYFFNLIMEQADKK